MSTAAWPTCPVHGRMEECTIADTRPAFWCLVSTAPSIFERPTQDQTQAKMAQVPASQILRPLAEIGQNAACPCAHSAASQKRKIRSSPLQASHGGTMGRLSTTECTYAPIYLPTCSSTGQNGPKCARKGVPSRSLRRITLSNGATRPPTLAQAALSPLKAPAPAQTILTGPIYRKFTNTTRPVASVA